MSLSQWILIVALSGSFAATGLSALPVAHAQDELVTMSVEGVSKAESSVDAAREIQSKAIADAAREQVIEVIGDKRYQKNKGIIESRIVRQAVKFIPFVNPGQPVKQPDGSWKMPVELKISSASLRKMILEAGLLNDAEGPASILPMVAFTDRTKGVSARWWQGEMKDDTHKLLSQLSRSFHETLQKEFSRQGFHLIRPQDTQASPLPELLRAEKPSSQDLQLVSEYYHAPMVLKGDVRLRESRDLSGATSVSVKLQVVQVSGNRTVAELSRTFESEPGNPEAVVRSKLGAEMPEIAKDLSVQVMDAWQKGTLNANLIRLTLKGNLSPRQVSEFKTGLMKTVHEVKAVKERMFERGLIQFEIDYVGQPGQLADRMKGLQMAAFDTRLVSGTDQSLVLEVKAR